MGIKLVITLDEITTNNYLELARKKTAREVNGDCEPSGSSLTIDIAQSHYDSYVICENNEIGVASVNFVDV
jgi:hypothetical protein